MKHVRISDSVALAHITEINEKRNKNIVNHIHFNLLKHKEMSSQEQSKFDIWWNSPKIKRLNGAVYSIGAAVVIIGALFKLMHWPGAGLILSLGMFTEALLFILSAFDKPHKDYEWEKVFSFEGEGVEFAGGIGGGGGAGIGGGMSAPDGLPEKELKSLSSGIKNLSDTAEQLSGAMGSTQSFIKNMESASNATAQFASVQDSLNNMTGNLTNSYESLNKDMGQVVTGTKDYAEKVDYITKNLSSINSVYELQLKNIQEQKEAITKQTEHTRLMVESLNDIVADNQQIRTTTKAAIEEVNKYKEASAQLAKQIAELNQVYGNMLNSLN